MSNSFEENLERNSRKHRSKGSAKRSSKPGIIGRSKFTKLKSRNDQFREEFQPLLAVGPGVFAPDGALSDDGNSSEIRQRTSQFSSAVDLGVEKPSINGIEPLANLANGERSTDSFLQNDFVLLDIKEGDSLQSISLQYHCSVSDLKRANNLISNQEFYALRQLRIPVKKHGLLTERLPPAVKIDSDGGFSSAGNGYSVRTVSVGIGPISPGGSQEDAVAFFRKMDEDLVKIMQNTKSQKDSLEAATIALTSVSIQPLVKGKSHSGADCGIQWRYLVIVVILLGLILPIITVIYMYTEHHGENNPELHDIDSHAEAFISLKKVNTVNKR